MLPVRWTALPTADPPSGGLPRISLARGALSDTSVEFRDDSTGVLISLTGLTIDMALDGANGAATLAGSGILNGQTVRLDLDTGDINALLAGQVERVSLKSQLADIKFDFEGRAGLSPFTLDGQTTLDAPQLTPVFALVGQTAPALPGGWIATSRFQVRSPRPRTVPAAFSYAVARYRRQATR